ncbi:MAG TPA: HD domain-containing protein [Methylophaga aminisulfidivorans]|uniref:HD domain-containing protein n=2 Tax=root TaxID=1 RepID=A0A7C1ZXM1_9GAMM|nr:HD domain-containing protein [Methylophaga aminisulfidivorans]
MKKITDFFLELDALKHVQRRSYITGGHRLENSAEHSWHLAMACWSFADYFQLEVDMARLLKYALVHDLGEIDAGDTFLYSAERSTANQAESRCVQRLASHPGNPIKDLPILWDEQEFSDSTEATLMKAVDRLLPFLLNISNEGKTWIESGVKKSQVIAAHDFIGQVFPDIHQWVTEQIEIAVENNWLLNE